MVAIGGQKRSGKDLLAGYLDGRYEGVRLVRFSDPIIREVNHFLASAGHAITERNKDHPPYRRLLQAWGYGRTLAEPGYWVDHTLQAAREAADSGASLVVVTGVRFPQDIAALRQIGAVSWLVVRPGLSQNDGHVGEHALTAREFDAVLHNNVEGDVTAFVAQAVSALHAVRKLNRVLEPSGPHPLR